MVDVIPPKKSKLRRYALRGLIVLFVLALLGGTGFTLFMKIKFADFQPPMAPANVIISITAPHQFKDRVEAIGTITANESAMLTTTVTETVKAINIEEGQFVEKGTAIVELTDDEEQANLSQASRSYDRYNQLVKNNLASPERRDAEQANFKVAQAQLDKRKIIAPFSGYLGVRNVNVGDTVSPGTTIMTIDSIDPIKLDFTVPEIYLSSIKKDMVIEATTAAWPNEVFTGKIYVVDSRIDPESRAIKVRAMMTNSDFKLKPGLLMKVSIIRSINDSVAVPESAILAAGTKKSVFVVGADKVVSEKEVVTGQREPGLVEIVSGLANGDKVIIEGQMKTGAGATVNIVGEKTITDMVKEDASYSIPRKQEGLKQELNSEAGAKVDGQAK
jgi:membrane fusion protein (multidrug efflux system)